MKKIILSLIIFIVISLGISNKVFAENNYKGPAVFKIYNYSYNKLTKIYDLQSYGSAVYLGNNLVLTNNHVVKSFWGGYSGYYEVCETIDFKKSPNCFSSAQLLYVDKIKDLAILKLDTKPTNDNGVSFSDKKISIGDKIETYGYPSNGGETITFTSGKISGFDSGRYKIDASIDSGSSGGGAFDQNGKLVGITTYVISGYTTLGYIVPLDDIKTFLAKKLNIKYIKTSNLDKFKAFLKKYQKRIKSDNIITSFIEIRNISKYGFYIFENIFDENEEINKFFLSSKSGYTFIEIYHSITINDADLKEKDFKNLNKLFNLKNSVNQGIYYENKKYFYGFKLNKTTKEIEILFNKDGVNFLIKGNLEKEDEIKNAILLFFKDSKIKKIEKYQNDIIIEGLKITKNVGFSISKFLNKNNNVSFNGLKIVNSTIVSISGQIIKFQKPDSYDTSNIDLWIKTYKKKFSGKGIRSGFFTDDKGNLFSYVEANNGIFVSYNFEIVREIDGKIYSYNFIVIVYGNDNVDETIKTFFKNLEFEGKGAFTDKQIKDAKIKNIDEMNFTTNMGNNIEVNPNFKKNYTKQEAFDFLQKITKNKLNITNSIINYSNSYLLSKAKNKLLDKKYGKKYIEKFNKIIPKFSTKKLEKISKKLEKLDLNNPKLKKYKLLLEYIKYLILVELEKRK